MHELKKAEWAPQIPQSTKSLRGRLESPKIFLATNDEAAPPRTITGASGPTPEPLDMLIYIQQQKTNRIR